MFQNTFTGAVSTPLTSPRRITDTAVELADRRHQRGVVVLELDLLGELLALGKVGGCHELALQLLELVVLGPAEPALLAVAGERREEQRDPSCRSRPSRS